MAESRDTFDTVEDAIYAVAHYSDRPLKAQASRMGVTADWLRDAVDPARKPKYPAALIVPHTLAAGNFAIVTTLCREVGLSCVPLPAPHASPQGPADVLITLAAVLRSVGRVAETLTASVTVATSRLPNQAATPELDDAIAKLVHLRALVVRGPTTAATKGGRR